MFKPLPVFEFLRLATLARVRGYRTLHTPSLHAPSVLYPFPFAHPFTPLCVPRHPMIPVPPHPSPPSLHPLPSPPSFAYSAAINYQPPIIDYRISTTLRLRLRLRPGHSPVLPYSHIRIFAGRCCLPVSGSIL
ncbi:hypothetical protein PLEOSDRAFT_153870 [Pleurotus ostreatus PC15]|uniref:Uncharacterized protein n=1 Tax=Pleurotus ostreatus (strain PC15) TaxID=1137138 RepID=A0A067P5G5_PLEO1|nr:hypothetical protein PLEOSDRAFT_153870 [Pleurotus ostreatus PC15]